MIDFNEVIEKLKDILSHNKIKGKVFDKDVASALGISQATFATMKKRNSIPYKEIMEFCAKNKISINWLFFDQPAEMLVEETSKFFRVRYYTDLRVSAGGGAEVYDENFEYIDIDKNIITDVIGLNSPKNIEALKVEGESMEPTLQNGSIVFIDRSNQDITRDGIFVASTQNGLFIKRIRRRVDGMVELISDNQLYSPEILLPQEVSIVGKVVGVIDRL